MNRILMIFLLQTTLSLWAISQPQTIEIEVSDTIQVVPDKLTYMFTINREKEPSVGNLNQRESISPIELKKLIRKYPKLILVDDDPSTLQSDVYETLLSNTLIKSSSKISINSLISELNDYTNISGNVIEMIVNDTEPTEIILKQRLLKLAKNKALITAQLIDRELGEIQSIVEFEFVDQSRKDNEDGARWTAYPPLSRLAHVFGTPTKANDNKVYFQKMKITFNLK